jgi:phosphoribosylformylglycinamidine (FGAM) synthase-like amidotransferase family enzyme
MKQIFITAALLIASFLPGNHVFAQKCQDEIIYKTSSVGNGKQAIPYALMFIIKNDTLRIANNEQDAMASNNVPFKILEKKCSWTDDYKTGKSFYKLSINNNGKIENPTLTIELEEKRGSIILQYENLEPRVFEIVVQATGDRWKDQAKLDVQAFTRALLSAT